MASHVGIVATMFARYPKIIDFSCGFQSYLPVGTCSRARRERSTSLSSSARKNSVSFICVSSSILYFQSSYRLLFARRNVKRTSADYADYADKKARKQSQ